MNDLSVTPSEIRNEFLRNKSGMVGIGILTVLVLVSIITLVVIPADTIKDWNNPVQWIAYPKTAMPSWAGILESVPQHKIITQYTQTKQQIGDIHASTIQFPIDYQYDQFPNDFIASMQVQYEDSPLVEMQVLRPDQTVLELIRYSLPHLDVNGTHVQQTFSTEVLIKKNLEIQSNRDVSGLSAQEIIFSNPDTNLPLKGVYIFSIHILNQQEVDVLDAQFVLGGKTFGLMGTDELRRDLAVGLLWGTPLALFIGLAVSIGSVVMGLIYGVYAGYKGKKTDEALMRFNDVIYALPALPFLIILAVTISNSIFVMIGFLMIFGWVGIAKVSRSMALQIKTRGYVDAAKIMGQKNSKIIFKHILPQLLPYAFASIAISVPAAITTEAGLSFLGLGDPSFPTWGQLLHDASIHGAAARGLWWWIVPPGIMIAVTGLAFVFIGNALDAIANPRLKG